MTDTIGTFRAGVSAVESARSGLTSANASRTNTAGQTESNAFQAEAAGSETTTAGASSSALATKETFLTLLVAQIKNQNPLNPADGTEFLTQLAQFTQLEQLISIREELEAMGKQNQALIDATYQSAT
jgi:flagellar hook assembly protein FlgD